MFQSVQLNFIEIEAHEWKAHVQSYIQKHNKGLFGEPRLIFSC
jgi:hypothetical protein